VGCEFEEEELQGVGWGVVCGFEKRECGEGGSERYDLGLSNGDRGFRPRVVPALIAMVVWTMVAMKRCLELRFIRGRGIIGCCHPCQGPGGEYSV